VFEPEKDSLSMHCDSRTILINAANYCYHLIVKIYFENRSTFGEVIDKNILACFF